MPIILRQNTYRSWPKDDGKKASVAWSTGRWRNFISQPVINFDITDPATDVSMNAALKFNFSAPTIIGQETINDEFSRGASLSYPNGIDPNPARWKITSFSAYLKENTSNFSSGVLQSHAETDAPGGASNIMRHLNPAFTGDFTFHHHSQNAAGNHEFGFRVVDSITGEMWRCGLNMIGSIRTDFSYWDGGSWSELQSTGRQSGTFEYYIYRVGADIWAKAGANTYNVAPVGSTNPMLLEFYHRTTSSAQQKALINYIRKEL